MSNQKNAKIGNTVLRKKVRTESISRTNKRVKKTSI